LKRKLAVAGGEIVVPKEKPGSFLKKIPVFLSTFAL